MSNITFNNGGSFTIAFNIGQARISKHCQRWLRCWGLFAKEEEQEQQQMWAVWV
jgi:hypothetical protein